MKSIWTDGVDIPRFKRLTGAHSTDVLIIGGGIAGILTAYRLRDLGISCMLIEKGEILGGVTQNTTAKLTIQHGLVYARMLRRFGYERTYLYIKAGREALEQYERLADGIDCDYKRESAYVYSLLSRKIIEDEVRALKYLGVSAEFTWAHSLPFDVAGAVRIDGQAQLHPLKFLSKIAEGLPIYEKTRALEIKRGCVLTDGGEVYYNKLIVATHFPIMNRHGSYFLKMYQHRSYVMALEGAGSVSGMYIDEAEGGLSFRDYGDLLLLGGGGHRTGKSGGGWHTLERFISAHYREAKVVGRWATQDCMTLDGIPYIGKYSLFTPNIYVATGFNKWGMTSAMVASLLLGELVSGKESEYERVFSPSRSILRPQLAKNVAETAVSLLSPFGPRCTHLGCRLRYNAAEHTWDCACHGSRYDRNGQVLNNPATRDKDGGKL